MRITCPHCGQPGKVRSSRAVTAITREVYAQCENIDCCHVWKAIVSAVSTIVPPLNPNPQVYLQPSARTAAADEQQLPLPIPGTGS